MATLPYPGFATDYKPLFVTLLTVADGVGIVTENLFFGRFRYVEELRRMGADIRTEGHHAVVRGVDRLSGAPVRAFDVRAGAALVLAGLVADGETVISDAHHVDRGYEDLDGKLVALGAKVVAGSDGPAAPPGYAPSVHGRPPMTPIPRRCSTRPAPATGWRCPACCRWSSAAARVPGRWPASPTAPPGQAYTVGITGAPGAGKSTLTDRLIARARTERGLDG